MSGWIIYVAASLIKEQHLTHHHHLHHPPGERSGVKNQVEKPLGFFFNHVVIVKSFSDLFLVHKLRISNSQQVDFSPHF